MYEDSHFTFHIFLKKEEAVQMDKAWFGVGKYLNSHDDLTADSNAEKVRDCYANGSFCSDRGGKSALCFILRILR
ncbi:hypothetical protein NPIL_62501 [Nephila pilipes]|uniref:Uncharacterized protein n=1 Tax=Nephila pilipes TaxID=299642 RepID=A0A8X6MWA9_NEPPI|nr:hypothetical protein NPIL_62501 [Nephila pilipes]